MRLDTLLVERGLARSRARATALIKDGKVKVAGIKKPKPSIDVPVDADVTLLADDHPYVSRAALKLKALADATGLLFKDRVVLDIGAAHGGFTQLALEYGAAHVYAVDVGTGQLDSTLKTDPKVTSYEQTDARALAAADVPQRPHLLLCDVSFISATKVLPHLVEIFPELEEMAILVKPQFELTPQDIGPGGVVRDKAKQYQALERLQKCLNELGFDAPTYVKSPLKGEKGNQEFMLHGRRAKPQKDDDRSDDAKAPARERRHG